MTKAHDKILNNTAVPS